MNTQLAITANEMKQVVALSEARKTAMASAKTYLLAPENKPEKDQYGTVYRRISGYDYIAYAMLRGKDWRNGIEDLFYFVSHLNSYIKLSQVEDHIRRQMLSAGLYGTLINKDALTHEEWSDVVDEGLSTFKAVKL